MSTGAVLARPPAPRRWWRGPSSLRARVTVVAVSLLAVTLVLLFVFVDLALSDRLHSEARTRLTDRVALAQQLDGTLSAQQLVDRLRGDGVTAQLCTRAGTSTGQPACVFAEPAPSPPAAPAPAGPAGAGPAAKPVAPVATVPVRTAGSVLFATATLSGDQLLTLSTDTTQISSALSRLVLLEVIGGLLALVVAALLLSRLARVALRPLDDMTALASEIARGDRGRRLNVRSPRSELGRTGLAFDAMLDDLERSAASAEAAEARLRAFLADASHELRTPLTGLQLGAESLLRETAGPAEREQTALVMVREARRATRLVEDLLEVARAGPDGAAQIELRPQRLDLGVLVEAEVQRSRVSRPDCSFHFAAASVETQADPGRVAQILANLLDNAGRAAGAAGTVRVTLDRRDDLAVIRVTDDGPGIAASDAERIFDRFVRLDSSRSRHTGGAGLGLPIARGLARAHGGDLRCVPAAVGRGACFELTLPVRA